MEESEGTRRMRPSRTARDSSAPRTAIEPAADTWIAILARGAGLVLLLVGLWAAVTVIREAWALYDEPRNERVEAFARAIAEGTRLDAILETDAEEGGGDRAGATRAERSLRISYFLAWGLVLIMLLLVGRLSIAAIKTGADLALYDAQIKRLRRELMREIARDRRPEA